MGAFGGIIRILQYAGLYIQLNAALSVVDAEDVDNHVSGNDFITRWETQFKSQKALASVSFREVKKGSCWKELTIKSGHISHKRFAGYLLDTALFTEVPHDITTQSGEDVEMACSFRGAGSPSFSLEIQWWYIKNHRNWQEKSEQITNHVVPPQETSKEATKISVVKVAGSNISHKLRLSTVKPSDEGTYECRVIDFSGSVAQQHRVHAYLQVEAERSQGPEDVQRKQQGPTQTEQRDLKTRSADCNESCAL